MNTPYGYLGYAASVTVEPDRRQRLRLALVVAALVCTVLLFFLLGHGLHVAGPADHDAAAASLTGVCLALLALIAPLAALLRPVGPVAAVGLPPVRPAWLAARPPAIGARASPSWLQRFLR